MKTYLCHKGFLESCGAILVALIGFQLLLISCRLPPAPGQNTVSTPAPTLANHETPTSAVTAVATAIPVTSITPSQRITMEFGVAVQGKNEQSVEVFEMRPIQAISGSAELTNLLVKNVSNQLTGTIKLELVLTHDNAAVDPTNSWLLYYEPAAFGFDNLQTWREYISYDIDPDTEDGEDSEIRFGSSYLITRTIILTTITDSESPTTVLDWVGLLDRKGFRLDRTARFVFRQENNGILVRRILIVTGLSELGSPPFEPDDFLVCKKTRSVGKIICKIIHVLGF